MAIDGGVITAVGTSVLSLVAMVAFARVANVHTLVTQNVDGLHHAAGSDPGLEIVQKVWPDEDPFTTSRRELLERLRGGADYREPRTIDVHVRHLREKLEREAVEELEIDVHVAHRLHLKYQL